MENKLRIPLNEEFLQKKTNDNLYGYLLANSKYDKEVGLRYIPKSEFSVRSVLNKISTSKSKSAIARDFDKLKEIGLISQHWICDSNDREVEIIEIEELFAPFCLIPKQTIEFMYRTFRPCCIKVYAYLLNKEKYSIQKYQRHYNFTIKELLTDCLKLSNDRRKEDRETIKAILLNLKNNGLINYDNNLLSNEEFEYPVFTISEFNLYPVHLIDFIPEKERKLLLE